MPALQVNDGTTTREWDVSELRRHPDLDRDGVEIRGRRWAALPVTAVIGTDLSWITATSTDGAYVASIPAEELLSGGRLLVGSPNDPLTELDGGPVRLVVEEGETLCWNVKHLGSLAANPTKVADSVPEDPPH